MIFNCIYTHNLQAIPFEKKRLTEKGNKITNLKDVIPILPFRPDTVALQSESGVFKSHLQQSEVVWVLMQIAHQQVLNEMT